MAQAGAAGIEPAIHGFKVRCLTTWPRPRERKWAHEDSNLGPTGYASHYSFRCPFRVCGLDYPFTP